MALTVILLVMVIVLALLVVALIGDHHALKGEVDHAHQVAHEAQLLIVSHLQGVEIHPVRLRTTDEE